MKNRETIFYERIEKLVALIAHTIVMHSNICIDVKYELEDEIDEIVGENK